MTEKKKKKSTMNRPLFFKKIEGDESDDEISNAIVEALLPVINEERAKEGLGPLPD